MSGVAVSSLALAGNALRGAAGLSAYTTTGEEIDAFAQRHHKEARFLNRGSVVTAATIARLLSERWPGNGARPDDLALFVGTGFGNQGETTAYFDQIQRDGPAGVSPMASYDVAVNSFVSFSSTFFGIRGPVSTLSSGAVSGVDALVGALRILEFGEARAVAAVGAEHQSREAAHYTAAGGAPTEACAALLLERQPERPEEGMTVVDAEVCFIGSRAPRAAAARAMVRQMLRRAGWLPKDVAVACAGPAWSDGADLLREMREFGGALFVDPACAASSAQLGAFGTLASILVLQELRRLGEGLGLVIASDPAGWLGAVLVAVQGSDPGR